MKATNVLSITFAAVLCGLLVLSPYGFGQQEEQSVEGALVSLDIENQTITLQDSEDMQMTFAYDGQTEIVGTESGVQGLANRTGTEIRVLYTPDPLSPDAPLARQIQVLPE